MDIEITKLPFEENLTREMLENPETLAKFIVAILDSKKARDIKLLHVEKQTVIADYFVICTANSTSHIKSLVDIVEFKMEEVGEPAHKREGDRNSGWIVLDFGCVIVHVFMEEAREFYDLERLWADAQRVDIENLG